MTSLNTATSKSSGRQSLKPPFLACCQLRQRLTYLCNGSADSRADDYIVARVDKDTSTSERWHSVSDGLQSGSHVDEERDGQLKSLYCSGYSATGNHRAGWNVEVDFGICSISAEGVRWHSTSVRWHTRVLLLCLNHKTQHSA